MRALGLVFVFMFLACGCKTPLLDLFGVDRGGVCADVTILDDGGAFACDEKGELVACAGKRALGKHGGLNVCTQDRGAGFILVCTKGVGAGEFEVELLPCAHCNARTPDGAHLGVVDFDVSACRLPELPVYDAGSPADVVQDEPDAGLIVEDAGVGDADDAGTIENVDAGVEEFKPCPCTDDGFHCDEDLGVCVHTE